jgi:putative transposase
MDFVFDRTAEGRSIKSLTVVDDATHEAVAIVPERALGGNQLVRSWSNWPAPEGYPKRSEPTTAKNSAAAPC